jgi:hypothetical protein
VHSRTTLPPMWRADRSPHGRCRERTAGHVQRSERTVRHMGGVVSGPFATFGQGLEAGLEGVAPCGCGAGRCASGPHSGLRGADLPMGPDVTKVNARCPFLRGKRAGPELAGERGYLWYGSVGVCEHSECADVFVFSDREHAYRLPTDADTDLFMPVWVCWWYAANPVWTLRALRRPVWDFSDPDARGDPGSPPPAGGCLSVDRPSRGPARWC